MNRLRLRLHHLLSHSPQSSAECHQQPHIHTWPYSRDLRGTCLVHLARSLAVERKSGNTALEQGGAVGILRYYSRYTRALVSPSPNCVGNSYACQR
jgi:hypothetical protein